MVIFHRDSGRSPLHFAVTHLPSGLGVIIVRRIAFLVLALAATGCATHSSNMRIGNDMSGYSLIEQRAALKAVKVYEELPPGAEMMGEVDAARCHRNFVETSPAREVVLNDLKLAAFARGADGLAEVSIEEVGGLHKNCWYILNGKAKMLTLPGRS